MKNMIAEYGMAISMAVLAVAVITCFSKILNYVSFLPL